MVAFKKYEKNGNTSTIINAKDITVESFSLLYIVKNNNENK